MSDIKNKVQGLDPNVTARDIDFMVSKTHNMYETLSIITKRARQIGVDMKQELQQKLQEFSIQAEAIEEVHENKEQIEISKFYERLPNPVIIALDEFMRGDIKYRYVEEKKKK